MEWHKKAECHCGSGKRYVACCFAADRIRAFESPTQAADEELRELVRSRVFDSPEAMSEFARSFCDKKNAEPRPEYLGLSADQVHMMIEFPLEGTQDLVILNESLRPGDLSAAPIVEDATFFLRTMAEAGPVKATVTGNLGRDFARRLFDVIDHSRWKEYVSFRSEEDSSKVQSLRLVLTQGGWIRRAKGVFRLTRRGERSVQEGFSTADFLRLFWTFTGKFNWAFQDRYPEFQVIQRSYLFSLFLIHRKARDFIEDYSLTPFFIRAFPLVLAEEPEILSDPFWTVNVCYVFRFLERFCAAFGLIETKPVSKDPKESRFRFKASPFFDKLLQWRGGVNRSS